MAQKMEFLAEDVSAVREPKVSGGGSWIAASGLYMLGWGLQRV
jgi:hypothetical protein